MPDAPKKSAGRSGNWPRPYQSASHARFEILRRESGGESAHQGAHGAPTLHMVHRDASRAEDIPESEIERYCGNILGLSEPDCARLIGRVLRPRARRRTSSTPSTGMRLRQGRPHDAR